MKNPATITTLFVDIGGVLLSDGWSYDFRKLAAVKFGFDYKEVEIRHNMAFDTFELGNLTMEKYLDLVVFYKERHFTRERFQEFIFARSEAYPNMIGLIRRLKIKYGLKVVAVSNEAREINDYRIEKFKLNDFIDFFVSSCYVGIQKPNADIYRLALDLSQVPPEQIIYIENTSLFVEVAEGLGIHGIWHTDYASTYKQLAAFGLEVMT